MGNGSVWSNAVFKKEVISPSNNKILQPKPDIMHLKAHKVKQQGFFPALVSCKLDDKLSPNVHRFVILSICWDTPSEKTGRWQLPNVSSAFKDVLFYFMFNTIWFWLCCAVAASVVLLKSLISPVGEFLADSGSEGYHFSSSSLK